MRTTVAFFDSLKVKTLGAGLALGSLLLPACGPTEQPAETPAAQLSAPAPGPELTSLADSNIVALLTPYLQQYPGSEVIIRTRLGDMRVRLYDDTPLHKANFLLLARKGFFDQVVFNRVEKGVVIQAGRSETRTMRINRYRLPAEIRRGHFHKYGALGMARYDDEQNPDRLSANKDFYIVQGTRLSAAEARARAGRPLTPEEVKAYETVGGLPSLDGKYTVFGEVTAGLEVMEKMMAEPVGTDKWPNKDVTIKMEVVK